MLRASDLPRNGKIVETLDSDLLIPERVRAALEQKSATGLELHQVRTNRTNELAPWWCLRAPHVMRRMSELTDGVLLENQCPHCGRDGHFGSVKHPQMIRYDLNQSQIDELPDFVSSWECFGNSRIADPFTDSHFSQPLLLAKPRVATLLAEGDTRIKLDPIEPTVADG